MTAKIKNIKKSIDESIDKSIDKKAIQIDLDAGTKDGNKLKAIKDNDISNIANNYNLSIRDIYVKSLEIGIYPYRYIKNINAISLKEQIILANSKVAVVGCGGLGGHVILLLSRIGIGFLTIIDYDIFDETNLNRQALSSVEGIGHFKANEAKAIVKRINPGVETTSYTNKISKNTDEMFSGVNVIVDALDNISDRFYVESKAKELKIPLVHGAINGFEGQITTVFPEDSGLCKIYSDKNYKNKNKRGMPVITPSTVASFQAMEVIKILLKRKNILKNKMLHINLEDGLFNIFSL